MVFSDGEHGRVHVLAHRLFDENRVVEGHRLLGRWLRSHRGAGSRWVHLHFHMALFELEIGDWDAAHERFLTHILPAGSNSDNALTDAPALLWRLQLTAPRPVALPWEPLRRRALERMRHPSEPFVELHNLLALAGARDLDGIEHWLRSRPPCNDPGHDYVLRRAAVALRDYAGRWSAEAGEALRRLLPQLSNLGGSLAQTKLFEEIAASGWRLNDQTA